jgi:hypothetical protein
MPRRADCVIVEWLSPDRTLPRLRLVVALLLAPALGLACERKPEPPASAAPPMTLPAPPAASPPPAQAPPAPDDKPASEPPAPGPAKPARRAAEAASQPSAGGQTAPAPETPPKPAAAPPAPASKPAPQAKVTPAKPAPEAPGIATRTTTGTTATGPAPASTTEADPAPDAPAKPAPASDAGLAAEPPQGKPTPPRKEAPAPQAKVVATTPALNIEAEQLARKDGGPSGPDYANAPRRPRGGGGNDPPPEPVAPTKAIPGSPLNIPGSKVDFEARRVERFLNEGGAVLAGRVLDADTGKGVDDAGIEAWMGTRSIHADTDASGAFRFEGMVPGSRVTLWITATQKYVQERIEVAIPADRPRLESTFKLLPRSAATGRAGGIGVFLSRRAGRTVISGLDAFGPAERAGLSIGDAIVTIGKRNVSELGPGAIEYLLRGTIGENVDIAVAAAGDAPSRKLTLKRAGR